MNKHFDNFKEATEALREAKNAVLRPDPQGGFIVETKETTSAPSTNKEAITTEITTEKESLPVVASEFEDTVIVVAEPRHRDFRATFIESLALPKALLDKANLNPSLRAWLLQNGKWRIDFPRNAKYSFSDDLRSFFSIAQKKDLAPY